MSWKKYQADTAAIFNSIGWKAEIEKDIEGVRGTHEVDVFVTFKQHGIDCRWVIECKCWNSSVPKEKVLALQSIVDDIGADKGVLVSKEGFQSGAIKQSQKSNIFLTSLDELKELVEGEILSYKAENLEKKLVNLNLKYDELVNPAYSKSGECLKFGFLEYGIIGMDGKKTIVLAWLLRELKKDLYLNKVQSGSYKIYLCDEGTDFNMNSEIKTKSVNNQIEYLENLETIIGLSSKWLQEKKVPFECT
ncbi:restriction endonuclease [Vibrio fluvialis]|nr:restriction endonuclease [Vibrio fluvialis]EKZ9003177.1 restriction endonuclease [Vibrio fluvialis]ELI1831909.1 restriction endonuclease [Vibrio fluvialis]